MKKEYEIYYEAYDIENVVEREKFILEKCGGDRSLFENIMRLFPDEQIDDDAYGKYRIEREIGQGGMGIVYLAAYTETFGAETFKKKVALKTISPQQKLDAKNIKIFLQEIKTLAELEHPNIARFLDIGTSEKGKPFFVMEYVDGLSLIEYCNKNKLSINERLAFFRKILDAIDYSHHKGFIHCDIKPNNILVSADGTPKVIDFGIASKYGSFISDKKTQTTFLQRAFTLNYASPEQLRGERNLLEATDIYSLGVVLYELLSGQLPLEFDEELPFHQIITTSENRYPPPLKKSIMTAADNVGIEKLAIERDCRSISELREDLTNDLDEIVQKAINKKPSKRYENVKILNTEIEEFLYDESFSMQIKRAFVSLYRQTSRKFRRLSLKRLFASIFGLVVLFVVLSQLGVVHTIPYYLKLRFAENNQQISLSASQKQSLEGSIAKLKESLANDLNKAIPQFNGGKISDEYNAWGLSDLIVSLSSADHPLDQNLLNSVIDKLASDGECWKEEKVACKMAISGWVLWSKSRLNKSVSQTQLDFVLRNQAAEGWFPAYPYPETAANASTYSTALIILGLTEQLRLNLIAQADQERAKNAIEKGSAWILKNRNKESKNYFWIDCPNAAATSQTKSNGLDGMTIFVLHQIAKAKIINTQSLNDELKEIDSLWLERISQIPASLSDEAGCQCGTIVDNEVILDRTKQSTVPWSLMATIESYPNGSLWQKANASKWLEDLPFSEEYKGFYFIAAEYLVSLCHLREDIQ